MKKEIDEPIRDIILQLNKLGYKTIYSCAGYNYPGHIRNSNTKSVMWQPPSRPYIAFKLTSKNAQRIRKILKYGWTIKFIDHDRYYLSYSNGKSYRKNVDSGFYREEHFERNEKLRKESWGNLRKYLKKLSKLT